MWGGDRSAGSAFRREKRKTAAGAQLAPGRLHTQKDPRREREGLGSRGGRGETTVTLTADFSTATASPRRHRPNIFKHWERIAVNLKSYIQQKKKKKSFKEEAEMKIFSAAKKTPKPYLSRFTPSRTPLRRLFKMCFRPEGNEPRRKGSEEPWKGEDGSFAP